jgi:hypothetical protein
MGVRVGLGVTCRWIVELIASKNLRLPWGGWRRLCLGSHCFLCLRGFRCRGRLRSEVSYCLLAHGKGDWGLRTQLFPPHVFLSGHSCDCLRLLLLSAEVRLGSTAVVEDGCGGGGDWRRYSSRMSLATSLQGVVWFSPFSASSPGSIRAGLLLASALVPDRILFPGGLPVRGLVLQCLSNSRRSVEPAALFTRKHVVRT